MRINEIVVDFPVNKDNLTRLGRVRKSGVVDKLPSGHLVYADELTGLHYIKNPQGVTYYLDPNSHKLPAHYKHDKQPESAYIVVNPESGKAYSIHKSEHTADIAARKIRQWQKKNAVVIPTFN